MTRSRTTAILTCVHAGTITPQEMAEDPSGVNTYGKGIYLTRSLILANVRARTHAHTHTHTDSLIIHRCISEPLSSCVVDVSGRKGGGESVSVCTFVCARNSRKDILVIPPSRPPTHPTPPAPPHRARSLGMRARQHDSATHVARTKSSSSKSLSATPTPRLRFVHARSLCMHCVQARARSLCMHCVQARARSRRAKRHRVRGLDI